MKPTKANELRLGNLFIEKYSKKIIKVIELNEKGITFSGHFDKTWQANPIPLTEDILKKTPFKFDGFDNGLEVYVLGRISITPLRGNRLEIYFDTNLFCYIPSNLHSLQNFYFATMHEELTINI